jgi:hypothetical protein
VIGVGDTRVLLALVRVYERDGRATVRAVAELAHYSLDTTNRRLHNLADLELAGGVGTRGALRPLVARVR